MRAADHIGPGRQQTLHRLRRALGRGMRAEPVRMAEAGAVALDVEQVLCCEGEAGERTLARAGERSVVVAAEGTQRVVGQGPAGGVIVCSHRCLK